MRRALPRFGPGPAGAPPTFEPSIPLERPWHPVSGGVGGTATAASGVAEGYRIRRDRGVRVVLRCTEAEWPAARAWIEWAMDTRAPFPFRFFRSEPSSEHEVILVRPGWDTEQSEPEPSLSSRGSYSIELELRTADGSAMDTAWKVVVE